ncbi:hypothetical protein [Dactylosporangium salmoneum]|uniref:Uncharacterized protein n=1 Tax=Dactylosporangium salmoneum TaxID=53361 RepID=A0ABP5UCU8_9ACTN
MPSPDLDAAAEELFAAFAHRPRPSAPRLCAGHCTGEDDHELLNRIDPRDLDGELLDRYWWNTSFDWELMTYFMPSLLRALPADDGIGDFIVAIGLHARWPELTGRERAAVEAFVRAWFADTLRHLPSDGRTAGRVLDAAATIGLDVEPYLEHWATVGTREARWQLVDLVVPGPDACAEPFGRWLLTPAPRAMLAACAPDARTERDRDRLETALGVLALREQGRW